MVLALHQVLHFMVLRPYVNFMRNPLARQNGTSLGVDTVKIILERSAENQEKEVEDDSIQVFFGSSLPSMTEVRYQLIREALARADGNISLAAKLIGITRQSLSQYLKRPKLPIPQSFLMHVPQYGYHELGSIYY